MENTKTTLMDQLNIELNESFTAVGEQTVTFSEVVLEVMRHLEGAYALIFKSRHYPNELVACKRGSPLLLGVKVGYASYLLFVNNIIILLHFISHLLLNWY